MKFRRGDLIADKYRVVDRLGEGGMGEVLLATHELLGRPVAVKVTHDASDDPERRERFLREGRIMAQVSSPHAVRLNDVGQLPSGQLFLVMERLEGRDLQTTVERDGPLPIAIAVDVVIQTLDALAEAHSLGIVHRDLKPANIFITHEAGGRMVAKVLDFGISKVMKEDVSLTSTGAVMGSPLYMAPEQVRSAKAAHIETDIWALGIVLCESLTGQVPFNGTTAGEVFTAILEAQLPPIHMMRPEVPVGLIQVITKCLAKHRSERYQSCGELAQALAPYGTGLCQPNVARAIGFAPKKVGASSPGFQSGSVPVIANVAATMPLSASSSGNVGNASTQQSWTDVSNVGALAQPPAQPIVRVLAIIVGILGVLAVFMMIALYFHFRGPKDTTAQTEPSASAAVATAPAAASSVPVTITTASTPAVSVSVTPAPTPPPTSTAAPPGYFSTPQSTHTGKGLKDSSRTRD